MSPKITSLPVRRHEVRCDPYGYHGLTQNERYIAK